MLIEVIIGWNFTVDSFVACISNVNEVSHEEMLDHKSMINFLCQWIWQYPCFWEVDKIKRIPTI